MARDPFTAVARYFTPEVIARSREYLGRGRIVVRDQDGARLIAFVQCERERPYRVEVILDCDDAGTLRDLQGYCACPTGHRCRHLAAVACLAWQRLCPVPPPGADRERDEVVQWVQRLAQRGGAANEIPTRTKARRELRFVLEADGEGFSPPVVHTVAVSVAGSGPLRERAVDLDAEVQSAKSWLGVQDRVLYHELRLRERQGYGYGHLAPRLPPDETGPDLFGRLVATGRAHLGSVRTPSLRWQGSLRAEVGWHLDHRGTQTPALLGLPPGAQILALRPPYWVDPATGHCGPIQSDLSPAAAQALVRAPALPAEAAAGLDPARWPEASGIPLPRPIRIASLPKTPPVPVLTLYGSTRGPRCGWAHLSFRYGEAICDPDEPHADASIVSEATQVVRVPRDRAAESVLIERLAQTGLTTTEALERDADGRWPSRWTFDTAPGDPVTESAPDAQPDAAHDMPQDTLDEEAWLAFAGQDAVALSEEGWQVDRDPSFRWALATVDAWYAEVDEVDGGDWFALSMGVEIDGVRVGVLPAVTRALARGRFGTNIPEAGVVLDLGDGRRVRMPADRLRTIVTVLLELFGNRPLFDDERLRLPRAAAALLADLDPKTDLRWYGAARLHQLALRLAAAAAHDVPDVEPPPTLRAELREYQRKGLSWLQFQRTQAIGGILADDMGLGKTIQTLAHLLLEQHEGRLDRPCLVVAPTSVLPVWRDEAARFAPSLSVLVHHGPRRTIAVDALAGHDLVVTSYALLLRDIDTLAEIPWTLVVLDEAHAIKNPAAKVAIAARRLNARHRLCLTGTPLENNLTELWAQVDFVMPGLLGTSRRFSKMFRTPIEQDGDESRRTALVSRLAPFLLRRTKEDVLRELPKKTQQTRYAELGRAQRDLYEAVRLGVDADVRAAIDARGLARSQVGVLQALLKLREVCCHPQLVTLPAARAVHQSAKLELLTELVTELVAAGRRILVFSSFTRMLTIIGTTLDEQGIGWVKLTGATRKRDEVVARFSAGQVPVFLISLKAGGTGINLTAADTVIHYDPWWNPAAQDQATDRAHRIGQTRPVLVLSLVARGTVEERMMALQVSKRTLADGVLGAAAQRGRAGRLALGPDELSALLAPLTPE